ncbi:hypothetical protein [Ornithinibacillus contaminans]|uniref:hypothetical protein n=1 Tax=Ornithinibacillus contaminans TaxID=694055 RepID=UPI00064DB4A6|nr:hypothetical protein [Ornithinibacillus contaminans]
MSENKVYILLTDTGTLLTKIIKLYTKKDYNHASIAFDQELTEVYSFGRKEANNPFVGGFVQEDVTTTLFIHARCAVYSFSVTEDQKRRMKYYIEGIKSQRDDYRYNFLGLFGVMFNKPITRKNAFFCSQFVASVLEESNRVEFDKPLSLIAPHDLVEMADVQLEYEGLLMNYTNNNSVKVPRIPVNLWAM